MYRAKITGVGGYVPEYILTNKELESMVDTNDEWIKSRTGIEKRHILKDKDKATSDMGVEAVKMLIEKTKVDPDEIEFLVCGTVTPDMVFPDTANTICDKVGLKNAFGYDINAACSGFLYALHTASAFIKAGIYKKAIVIGADTMSSIIDYEDRATCIIFGDGAGAVLLERTEESENGVIDGVMFGDGSGREFLHMKAGGSLNPSTAQTVEKKMHYVYQEGRTVFKNAVRGMVKSVQEVLTRNNLSAENIDWIVPHQANIRIINTVAEMLDFPIEKVMVNIEKYGNTTAGTLPLCLWDYEDKLKAGDNIILVSFGGGFTFGAIYLKWAY